MPFLRVLRDKRGYETTYLIHWFRDGHGQRQRSRILYVFRTPPGVRVGRPIFEPTVMRELEARYPDIEFEWRSLMATQQVVDASPEPRHPRKRRPADDDREAPPVAVPPAQTPAQTIVSAPDRVALREAEKPASSPAQPRLQVPSSLVEGTPDEQVAWLRSCYPQIRERIPHRTHDPARREALYALAERLNPEPWVGDEAVAQGLHAAGEALQRLSHVFASKRRRPRRNPRGGTPGGGPTGT